MPDQEKIDQHISFVLVLNRYPSKDEILPDAWPDQYFLEDTDIASPQVPDSDQLWRATAR